jgi:hypothetical protein
MHHQAMRIVPLLLSSVVLAAHFYRSGLILLTVLALCAPALLLFRRFWAVATLQIALFVAAAEWVRTAVAISSARTAFGAPTARLWLILGGVALFTALSAIPLTRLSQR